MKSDGFRALREGKVQKCCCQWCCTLQKADGINRKEMGKSLKWVLSLVGFCFFGFASRMTTLVFYLSKWSDKKQVKWIKIRKFLLPSSFWWLQWSLVGFFGEDTALAGVGGELLSVIACLMDCAGMFGEGFFCKSSNICAKETLKVGNPSPEWCRGFLDWLFQWQQN